MKDNKNRRPGSENKVVNVQAPKLNQENTKYENNHSRSLSKNLNNRDLFHIFGKATMLENDEIEKYKPAVWQNNFVDLISR